jgi:dCTP deaminase
MIVVGENLSGLIEQFNLAPKQSYDQFSVTLTLHDIVFRPSETTSRLVYPVDDAADFFRQETIPANKTLDLAPGQTALACSQESISMPLGYMGFLQTKGSLARLMCAVHMNDAQIEPGFTGRVTFEIANHAPFPIGLRVGAPVSQMFIFRCSDRNTEGYEGRYGHSEIPTLFKPKLS